MRVLFVAAEVAPYAKVGGLGDVAAALPKALAALGHEVRVVTPDHGARERRRTKAQRTPFTVPAFGRDEPCALVQGGDAAVPVYLLANGRYFNTDQVYGRPDDLYRYHFFNLAVARLPDLWDWVPDIIHCNDWHTSLLPFGLRNLAWNRPEFRHTASVLTIHNLAYRGPDDLTDTLAQGIYYADVVSTVSPTYAREIASPAQGMGLDPLLQLRGDRLWGIANGVDQQVFNPATDPALPHRYDAAAVAGRAANKAALQAQLALAANPAAPLAGMVSRVDYQKGTDLLAGVIERCVTELGMQFALLGAGNADLTALLRDAAARFPGAVSLTEGYNNDLGQRIYGASDLFLMPSRFEPCGLGQLIAMRYGSIPVVRRTGGLADTVTDADADPTGVGFVFDDYDADALYAALQRAVAAYRQPAGWRALQQRAMAADHSWGASAQQYVAMYQQALEGKQ